MNAAALTAWLLAAMFAWREPATEFDVVRYAAIASDIAEVTDEYASEDRAKRSLLILSIAFWESGFDEAVDRGTRRGDHGRSWCIMQINIGRGRTPEGWSGSDLVADRKLCVRSALHRIEESLRACAALAEPLRLGLYVRGRCSESDRVSELRVLWAQRWWVKHPVSVRL